jgi:hypothetical protein
MNLVGQFALTAIAAWWAYEARTAWQVGLRFVAVLTAFVAALFAALAWL